MDGWKIKSHMEGFIYMLTSVLLLPLCFDRNVKVFSCTLILNCCSIICAMKLFPGKKENTSRTFTNGMIVFHADNIFLKKLFPIDSRVLIYVSNL